MHVGTPHATVTGQRQSLIKRRDQFWAIVALLVFVLIALFIIDGRVTSLVARLSGINQDLGYLRPILNLFGLGIVLALGWVVWRRILELPFPEFLADKRILGIAKYALIMSALVIAGIEAGTRWLPDVAKREAATFSLPLSLLVLALLIQTLQRVLAGHAGREGGESKGESSGRMGLVFSVLGILAVALLCGWLLLKIQGVVWAQGASHRMDLATEALRVVMREKAGTPVPVLQEFTITAPARAGTDLVWSSPVVRSNDLTTLDFSVPAGMGKLVLCLEDGKTNLFSAKSFPRSIQFASLTNFGITVSGVRKISF